MKYKEFKREAIEEAVQRYLECKVTIPEQFNIAYSIEKGWRCEFHEYETCWTEGYVRWIETAPLVLKIFFSRDPELIDLRDWEDEWNDQ